MAGLSRDSPGDHSLFTNHFQHEVRSVQTETALTKEVAEQVVLDRRHLHQHPELGRQEHQTAAFVAERLRSHGLEVRTGVAETGVIGLLRGSRAGRTVLLRADMDALPIEEQNDVPYRSKTPGL